MRTEQAPLSWVFEGEVVLLRQEVSSLLTATLWWAAVLIHMHDIPTGNCETCQETHARMQMSL